MTLNLIFSKVSYTEIVRKTRPLFQFRSRSETSVAERVSFSGANESFHFHLLVLVRVQKKKKKKHHRHACIVLSRFVFYLLASLLLSLNSVTSFQLPSPLLRHDLYFKRNGEKKKETKLFNALLSTTKHTKKKKKKRARVCPANKLLLTSYLGHARITSFFGRKTVPILRVFF